MGDTTRTGWLEPSDQAYLPPTSETFDSILVENGDQPSEIIIYPANDRTSEEWVVASGTNSFVSLESMC